MKDIKVSLAQYYQAKLLLKRGLIEKLYKGNSIISFKTLHKKENYSIIFMLKEGRWSCTCPFGSLFKFSKEKTKQLKECKHVIAAKRLLKNEQD